MTAKRQLSPSWLLVILTGLNLLNYVDRFVLNAVRTPMAESFHVNYGTSGRMFTAFMLGYFIPSPFFGYLGDRVSRKGLIAVGITARVTDNATATGQVVKAGKPATFTARDSATIR